MTLALSNTCEAELDREYQAPYHDNKDHSLPTYDLFDWYSRAEWSLGLEFPSWGWQPSLYESLWRLGLKQEAFYIKSGDDTDMETNDG